MANKAISELPQAQNVNNQDLFVLEQSGIAKKLTAETFITEQGIIDALAEALDGHGGIQSVTLSSVSGRIRTYLITFTDGSATTFQVYDGTTIERIAKTSTAGLVDTYTIFMNDGTTTFFTVTNGADGTVSEAMLNDALKDKAPAITETTESSAIANFTDGADDLVMHNIVAEINPVQSGSGDPSPSNIRPISGWTGCNVTRTGKNLWDEEWELGGINSTTGENIILSSQIRSKNFIPVKPEMQLYIKSSNQGGASTAGTLQGRYYNSNKQYLGYNPTMKVGAVVTVPQNCFYIRFACQTTYGTTYNHDISINYPSSDHDYHAYQGSNTVTLSWQTEAGTVYGGTIDVATGLLTVDRAMVTLNGSETITISNSGTANWFYSFGSLLANAMAKNSASDISSAYPRVGITNGNTVQGITAANDWVRVRYGTEDTVANYKAWLSSNPVQLCYELKTPQTYQLTPQEVIKTLYGNNTVWADTGNVTIKYPADTKMFIEKLTMPTEDDLVANQAITSGKYFMIGNSLYLALANIASGAQITIGTNAQRVSLADALNTINS